MQKNTILIICPSMWPEMNSWGETQRMYYLANYLALHGWEVYTAAPGYKNSGKTDQREKKYISYFFGTYKNVVISQKEQEQKSKRIIYKHIHSLLAKFLIPVINWVYNEPDSVGAVYKQLWIWKYQKEITNLIDRLKVRTVLISVPAFVLVKLGKRICRGFPEVKLVYDYRDAWHLWNGKKNLAYFLEKRYLFYADQVVGFSDDFSRAMRQVMGISEKKIATVYNGFSEKDWARFENSFIYEKEKRKKLRLAFIGNITLLDRKDNFRNPHKLIEAVNIFDNVELYFVGIKDVQADRTEKNVYYIGNVSQEESFKYMKMSDVLISIHNAQDDSGKYIISGKFYDYMRSGKVIWHIGNCQDLMTKMIQKYKLGVWCENEKDKLGETLAELVQCWKEERLQEKRTCKINEIRNFSRENQNKRYADILCEN